MPLAAGHEGPTDDDDGNGRQQEGIAHSERSHGRKAREHDAHHRRAETAEGIDRYKHRAHADARELRRLLAIANRVEAATEGRAAQQQGRQDHEDD